jgi:hypothetical protein
LEEKRLKTFSQFGRKEERKEKIKAKHAAVTLREETNAL